MHEVKTFHLPRLMVTEQQYELEKRIHDMSDAERAEQPFGFDRADWPSIDAWLTRISELPGWAHPYDLMPRALPAQT